MLKNELDALIPKNGIETGIMLCYGDEVIYQHNADKVFPAAGMIDLGIVAYIEEQWKKDPKILDEELEVTELSRVRGTGVISKLRQSKWSLRDLIYLITSVGDNTASNLLIERFDIYEIDEWLKENYPGIRLGREFMRYSATGQDNEVTATSMMKVLQHFITSKDEFGDLVRSGLQNHAMSFYLTAMGDTELPIFNKSTHFNHLLHEVSALRTQKGPLILVLLTEYEDNKSQDVEFIQEFGKLLYSRISIPQLPKTGLANLRNK